MRSLHFFFFNDTATTEIYTLSLHDALPIFYKWRQRYVGHGLGGLHDRPRPGQPRPIVQRSEEHTSELQSHLNLVCRLLLEKKKNLQITIRRFLNEWEAFKKVIRRSNRRLHI